MGSTARSGHVAAFARRSPQWAPVGHQQGISLIEVLVSLAVVSIIVVCFLGATTTSVKGTALAGVRTAAGSLARGHIEYVMSLDYSTAAWAYTVTSSQRTSTQQPSWWDASNPPLLAAADESYRLEVRAEDFDADGDGTTEVPGDDEGVRRITVEVYHSGDLAAVVTLGHYKVDL